MGKNGLACSVIVVCGLNGKKRVGVFCGCVVWPEMGKNGLACSVVVLCGLNGKTTTRAYLNQTTLGGAISKPSVHLITNGREQSCIRATRFDLQMANSPRAMGV